MTGMTETNITHHLPYGLMMAYSAGTLPEAFSLTIATHIAMCDECRAQLGSMDAVGGALLDDMDVAPMDDCSLEMTLARITGAEAAPKEPIARLNSDVPAPLADYIGGSLKDVRWRPIGMGVKQAILDTDGQAIARLLYIPAGTSVPDHGHRGTELTLVLRGAFSDETDRFGPGDIEVANEDLNHTPVADISGDCICLAATDAPLKFNSLIPRLAQRFLRI